MRLPRQPRVTAPWWTSRSHQVLGAVAILLLSLTGCTPSDPVPLPTVSPAPTSPTVQPTPITTTIGGPTPVTTTTIGMPSPTPVPTTTTTVPAAAQWTFLVVRNTNQVDDGSDDPPLTEAGKIRAGRLADFLSSRTGVAVYATSDRRAQDTAHPTAMTWDLQVTTYDLDLTPEALISQIKQRHPTGLVLIVGLSDTVPEIVGELCRCEIDPIPHNLYVYVYEIALQSDGAVRTFDRIVY